MLSQELSQYSKLSYAETAKYNALMYSFIYIVHYQLELILSQYNYKNVTNSATILINKKEIVFSESNDIIDVIKHKLKKFGCFCETYSKMIGDLYHETLFILSIPEDKNSIFYQDKPNIELDLNYDEYMAFKYVAEMLTNEDFQIRNLDFSDLNLRKPGLINNFAILQRINDTLLKSKYNKYTPVEYYDTCNDGTSEAQKKCCCTIS